MIGTTSFSSPGIKTIILGSVPSSYEIILGSRFGTSETYEHRSHGFVDQTGNQMCVSTVEGKTINSNAKCASHYDNTGTEIIAASHDSFHASGIRVNVTKTLVNYQFIIKWS